MKLRNNYLTSLRLSLLVFVLLGIYGCGGSGGDGDAAVATVPATTTPTASAATITSYLVDGPVGGVNYACTPSGRSGVTLSTGAFTCLAGDTAAFSLKVGSSTIAFGSVAVSSTSGVSVPVSVLPNGLQVASILVALNQGTTTNIDVSGLTIPATTVADINSYISSGGTLPAGKTSDDQFLASVQSQTTGGASKFVNPVTGSGDTFKQNVVLPHLQDTLASISASNPALPSSTKTTKLSGSILISGSSTLPSVTGCTTQTWTAGGGGIVNAVVDGNIQVPGTYPITFTFTNYKQTASISSVTCQSNGVSTTIPAVTAPPSTTPSVVGTDLITVTPAFSGNTLSLSKVVPPAGCTGGTFTGTDVGLSNPLITMTSTFTCTVEGAKFPLTQTMKLVGAF